MMFLNSSAVISKCIIYGNHLGGGIYLYGFNGTLTSSIIKDNTSNYDGGGIQARSSFFQISNCEFSLNSALNYGGALNIAASSSVAITNSTFTENGATKKGGGIHCSSGSTLMIKNCILWQNTPEEIFHYDKSSVSVIYSEVMGGFTGEGNFQGDPLFIDSANGDYRLSLNSPCVDAAIAEGAPDTDINGQLRPYGAGYDVGAYETTGYSHVRPVIDSFEGDAMMGLVPFEVTFTCSAYDSDGQVLSYTMEYGDGSSQETNTSGVFSHTYSAKGIGLANCTVTDDSGASTTSFSLEILRGETIHVPAHYSTIQDAIDAAVDGDAIVVADGTYKGERNKNLDYKGKAITVRSANGPEHTIIDCEDDGNGFILAEQNSALLDVILDGFTVMNGSTGIVTYGSPIVKNCHLMQNKRGIFCAQNPNTDSQDYHPVIIDCRISDNSTGPDMLNYGAGIRIKPGTSASVLHCIIEGNRAGGSGGGIRIDDGSLVTIDGCIIKDNTSNYHGGGISFLGTSLKIRNSIIAGNSSRKTGGGICFGGTLLELVNSTLSGNTATTGGALRSGDGSIVLRNNIVWDNLPDEIDTNESDITAIYNDIRGGFSGAGNFHGDPLFVDPANGNYRLMPESPCMDAGTSVNAPDTDIENNPRPQNAEIDLGAYEITGYSPVRPRIDQFLADISTDFIPFTVNFTCVAHDPDGEISSYAIDYGDGSAIETNGTGELAHAYSLKGVGGATCIVEDNSGTTTNSYSIIIGRHEEISVPSDFSTIQAGIDAATNGDAVIVADGTYTGEGNKNIDFMGKAITVKSENGPNNTIIDCERDGPCFNIHRGEGQNSRLEGFTITNGRYTHGRGIFIVDSSPTISSCIIKNNTTSSTSGDYYGGGIYARSTFFGNPINPVITNCLIFGNKAGRYGGGIYTYRATVTITNCTIFGNSVHAGGVIKNSILWCNSSLGGATTYSNVKGGRQGEGNIDVYPAFVDSENGDYRLKIYSPSIGAGTQAGAPNTDIEGNSRPNPADSGPDMGAYEHILGTPEMPPTGVLAVEVDNSWRYEGTRQGNPITEERRYVRKDEATFPVTTYEQETRVDGRFQDREWY